MRFATLGAPRGGHVETAEIGGGMFLKAFLTMAAADAVDRKMRERQRRAWIEAERARIAAEQAARPAVYVPPWPPSS